jgi:hypothetical protein
MGACFSETEILRRELIIAAMGLHVPIDLRPEIEEGAARGGLVAKFGRLEDRPEWAEATYLTIYHTEVSRLMRRDHPESEAEALAP